MQSQVLRDSALLPPGKNLAQVVRLGQLAVQVLGILRCARKPHVVIDHECRHPGVRCLNRRDAGEAQLLHQPILQRAKRALDAALRLRTVGADDVDVQFRQHPAELGDAIAADRIFGGDAEDARFVAVERHWLAVRLQVVLCQRGSNRTRIRMRRTAAVINRLVASSTNANRAHISPRSSNQRCSEPSICR